MKKLIFSISLLLCQLVSHADYNGTLTTNQTNLSFSTKSGYDVISLKDPYYTTEIGAPQIPVKTISILIPIDQKVSSIIINNTTIQQLSGTYNLYPVQTPIRSDSLLNLTPFDNPNSVIYNSTNPYPNLLYQITSDGYPMLVAGFSFTKVLTQQSESLLKIGRYTKFVKYNGLKAL